ncbi:MAG: HAMP domain-containing histidine kinase [Lachnospiraceae bacterium]|nr:HAMP domain-containing histidine kinase [Lachnospiraceae bacterium]
MERLKERDIIDLNAELEEKAAYIEKLEADNEELAKIIHSDNKLIPAMELAVTTFLKDGDASDYDRAERGEALVKDLERLSRNRKGILKTQDAKCQNIPPTGISSIDSLLSYMQQKAWEYDVTLVGAISCDLMPIIEKYLTEEELNTLLADLLENALIATQYNGSHHMLLQIDFLEKIYAISVYDSGIAFSKEVLVNLGLRNYTTHGDAGGSGIGLVSTFDLAQKCNASLVIDEYMPGSGLYSKKLSIVFNRLGQYNLYTYRGKKELDFLKQRTNLIITEKFSANTSPRPSAER